MASAPFPVAALGRPWFRCLLFGYGASSSLLFSFNRPIVSLRNLAGCRIQLLILYMSSYSCWVSAVCVRYATGLVSRSLLLCVWFFPTYIFGGCRLLASAHPLRRPISACVRSCGGSGWIYLAWIVRVLLRILFIDFGGQFSLLTLRCSSWLKLGSEMDKVHLKLVFESCFVVPCEGVGWRRGLVLL